MHALERALQLGQIRGPLDARALHVLGHLLEARQELVQRRVEQPDRDRQALHLLEQALEVLLLEGQKLVVEDPAALLLGLGHDHRAHLGLPGRRP